MDGCRGGSKHQHVVHEYGFVNRYDTEEARSALNHRWRAVSDRDSLDPAKLAADISQWQKELSEITASTG